ncbi:hypothetical protein FACS1894110_24350 [Spirochaetia bacterium]|nr:hypothetical protein FACS1894110_24350 [Spirochaetia bacterium]
MIDKWMVSNFKSIQEKTTLDFGPLTIFAGTNSSGKSTLLQSILLIAQTLSNRFPLRPIVLNGPLVSLGQFNDIKSFDSNENNIELALSCEPPKSSIKSTVQKSICSVSFSADSSPKEPNYGLSQVEPNLLSAEFKTEGIPINIEDFSDEELAANPDTSNLREIKQLKKIKMLPEKKNNNDYASQEIIGCELSHFLPIKLYYKVDQYESITQDFIYQLNDILQKESDLPFHRFSKYSDSTYHIIEGVLYKLLESEEDELKKVLGFNMIDEHTKKTSLFSFSTFKEILDKLSFDEKKNVSNILLKKIDSHNIGSYVNSLIVSSNIEYQNEKNYEEYFHIPELTIEETSLPETVSHSIQYLLESFNRLV